MMKLLNTEQIRQADEYTILHEPVSSLNLMERAANAFVTQLIKEHPDKKIRKHIFCGNGNNGGDGLAIARLLLSKGHQAEVYTFKSKKYSEDYSENLSRLSVKYKKHIHIINDINFINKISSDEIIIDAIFGTGLNKPIQKNTLQYQVIEKINQQNFNVLISVDIPSGLFADQHSEGIALKACKTYTFQFPKLAFLFPENGMYVNDFTVLDIGLHPDYITQAKTSFYFLTKEDVQQKLHLRKKYSHKGTYGHALIIAGSYGKMGAAVLSAKACLRSGCGLVSTHIPACGYEMMQTAFPEAMCSMDKNAKHLTVFPSDEKYNTIAVGPGIGTHLSTIKALEVFLKQYKQPIVADADALNILSKKKPLLKLLPANSILTPHPKEFERMAGTWKNDFERLSLQQSFSKKHKVIIVLKGANTSISDTNGEVYFNSTGNAGMATGGSGDVLTGIITGFLAQQYTPLDSAILGVYMHGLAGDLALQQQSMESLIASDIIDNLGNSFKEIKK